MEKTRWGAPRVGGGQWPRAGEEHPEAKEGLPCWREDSSQRGGGEEHLGQREDALVREQEVMSTQDRGRTLARQQVRSTQEQREDSGQSKRR